MSTLGEFKMPSLGADMDAGTLVEWMVGPGDAVKRGDIVAVVETQKGAIDVEIYQTGVIDSLVVEPGTEVPVGTVLATVRMEGEDASATTPSEAAPEPRTEHHTDLTPPPIVSPSTPTTPDAAASAGSARPPGQARPRVSPRAQRLASELGVDVSQLTGTGPEGAITAEDIQRASQQGTRPAKPSPPAAMRDAITAAMERANREIPHYYVQHTVDVEEALQRLERDNRSRAVAERIVPIALFVRAVARALGEYPQFGGTYRDGRFTPAPGIHVALAIALRGGGLVNPAIHDADQGTLEDLMARIADVSQRAKTSSLRASELSDAAITVSSLGDRGVHSVLPIIHPPQVAIVGVGTIAPRPWVVGDRVEPRRLVDISLGADHRVTDGHLGARFLQLIARTAADPDLA